MEEIKFRINLAKVGNKRVLTNSTTRVAICKFCGKQFIVPAYYGKAIYCSRECSDKAKRGDLNAICEVCGKQFHRKPSQLTKVKHVTCSRVCAGILKQILYSGENNPNYNNRKDRQIIYNNGHKYYLVHLNSHPFGMKAKGCGVSYKEHRYIVEQNYKRFDSKYFVVINGKYYLRPEVDVHHINENTLDNRIENLIPLTRAEHTHIHNLEKRIIREKTTGKIIGVVKDRELLESHNASDNQQPSLDSNIIEGSTTSSRVQTDYAEDSIATTSAVNQ